MPRWRRYVALAGAPSGRYAFVARTRRFGAGPTQTGGAAEAMAAIATLYRARRSVHPLTLSKPRNSRQSASSYVKLGGDRMLLHGGVSLEQLERGEAEQSAAAEAHFSNMAQPTVHRRTAPAMDRLPYLRARCACRAPGRGGVV